MSIADTLIDISQESSLSKPEEVSLRQIAKEVKDLEAENKDLRNLRDTVSINCNPPADCNDPKVLKTYMKACFDEAEKSYD